MVFIWRGAGVAIPIIILISAWITSYSFVDTRLGNALYMGWTLLWAGIVISLLGLVLLGAALPDPDTGEKAEKTNHDLFFIPVWIWGLGLTAFSIYLIN